MPSEASTLLLPSRLPLATSWPIMGLLATNRFCGSSLSAKGLGPTAVWEAWSGVCSPELAGEFRPEKPP